MTFRSLTAWLGVLLIALAMIGCASGEGEPQSEEPGAQPEAVGVPDPPPQEEVDVSSGGVSTGGNTLSVDESLSGYLLPPNMFGAISDFELHGVGVNPVAITGATLNSGSNSNLHLAIGVTGGNVTYTVTDDSTSPPTVTTVGAYAPTNGVCTVYSPAMGDFVSAGTTISAGNSSVGLSDHSLSFKIQPASETGCN
jgi:hypothetical protein